MVRVFFVIPLPLVMELETVGGPRRSWFSLSMLVGVSRRVVSVLDFELVYHSCCLFGKVCRSDFALDLSKLVGLPAIIQ